MVTLIGILVAVLTFTAACINGCTTMLDLSKPHAPVVRRCTEYPLRPWKCSGNKPHSPLDDLIGEQADTLPPDGSPMAQMAPPPDATVKNGYQLYDGDERVLNHGGAW